jgi:DNA-binding transcriptional MerR regulator
MLKSPEAFRTISEVAETLDVPPHVLRFWETRFAQVKPVKRGGGRRYYRPEDVRLLRGIRGLLYDDGMTIKGVQKILRERGVRHVIGLGAVGEVDEPAPPYAQEPPAAPEPKEYEVEELETETDRDASFEGEATAAPEAEGKPNDRVEPEPAFAGADTSDRRAAQAELFAAGSGRPEAALQASAVEAPERDGSGVRTEGKPASLRDLVARLEALRAEMTEDRRARA